VDLDDFRHFQFVEGEALLTAYAGTSTELGEFAQRKSSASR
jgi:hypothetical protein